MHSAMGTLMGGNKTLTITYHNVRVDYEDSKVAVTLVEQKALTAVDDAMQLKARLRECEDRHKVEMSRAKLTGAREFKASNVFQILVSRAAGETSSAVVEPVPDPSDPFYSLLDDQVCVISGSKDADLHGTPSKAGPSGTNQYVLAGGNDEPTEAEPSGASPNGVSLDANAGAGPSGTCPSGMSPDADAGPP